MATNIFEELQEKKQQLAALAQKACEYGWIDEEHKSSILHKLDTDVLTIGVIGQMKCGKSTFLNSFVFEDDILPAATIPMTAALSVITYGAEKKIEAEFYTADEWTEQKMNAERSLEEVRGNELEESKIKAAKELMEKAAKLGSNVMSYLGKKQEDSFDNLIEYVGADGKYISITKSVTIYYPKEYLRGVEIVDTPGFNDPIVSREERTKEFLKKADVVLLMLYAGRPFDANDRAILFKNVAQSGMGKVLIGINKYDIPYEKGETEEDITQYVKEEILKASEAANDSSLKEILKETTPVTLSAEMALLSELPMQKINNSDAFKHAWNRHCSTFEISSQTEMRQKSHIENLIAAVREVIEKEKTDILFRKPLNAIKAAGNKKLEKIEKDIRETKNMFEILKAPDDELEEKERTLDKLNRRINKKINGLGDDLDIVFDAIIRKGKRDLEDIVDECCNKIIFHIDDWRKFEYIEPLDRKIQNELTKLNTRKLPRTIEEIENQTKRKIKENVTDLLNDLEELLIKHPIYEDFDSKSFVKNIQKDLMFEIEKKVSSDDEESNGPVSNLLEKARKILIVIHDIFSLGTYSKVLNAIGHNGVVNEYKQKYIEFRSNFDAKEALESITSNKEYITELVKTKFIDELVIPLIAQLDEVRNNKNKKEENIKINEEKLIDLEKNKETIKTQIKEITTLSF